MAINIREFEEQDIAQMILIWNEVIEDGMAFPEEEFLDEVSGLAHFKKQTFTGAAIDTETEEIVGLYILHPNNVGRCGHISNASYAVRGDQRGKYVGEALVKHCLLEGKKQGFRILQFNAVVANNAGALHLYKKLGFTQVGIIPQGFYTKEEVYEDIVVHYKEL